MNIKDIFNKFAGYFKKTKSKPDSEQTNPIHDNKKGAEPSPFISSLCELKANDITEDSEEKGISREKITEIIRRVVMAVCAITFFASGAMLIKSFAAYDRGDEIYENITGDIFSSEFGGKRAVNVQVMPSASDPLPDYYKSLESGNTGSSSSNEEYNLKFHQMKANLEYLRQINPDIYGYIHIDGTNISYPIVKGEDNDYYLNRAYNGEYLVLGSIFADCYADTTIMNNMNTVFYGHNMQNGSMFNNVMLFLEEEVFNSKLIEIYTFDGIYTYEPFAIFETVKTFQYFRMFFADNNDFISFCELMQSKSLYNKGMTFTENDRLITLSTCTGSNVFNPGRYALHAKLIKVEK